jgi:hypothetical protein
MTDLRKGLSTDWTYPDHNVRTSSPKLHVELTERVDKMFTRIPSLLLDAASDSASAGLSRTMLRINHRLTYWKRDGKVLIGGERDATV